MAHGRHHKVDTRIVRTFNTYGPRMRADDGRMVPNFIQKALLEEPLTVYGDGSQTSTIQYIDDLIEGCVRLMKDEEKRPVNVGNPHEMSVLEIARIVIQISSSESELIYEGLPEDDPKRRCPQLRRAKETLSWEPCIGSREGLHKTLSWFSRQLTDRRQEASSSRRLGFCPAPGAPEMWLRALSPKRVLPSQMEAHPLFDFGVWASRRGTAAA